ncbi:cytochrome P450 [Clathrospora elynae]|uniref:Cytochrome P450 n=1 Tax=Clathrospora elynae TaxID=706981 RepID=A0A6A5SM31_9PLEO|nr:cytochrome P450 [Clathrospora elynae]
MNELTSLGFQGSAHTEHFIILLKIFTAASLVLVTLGIIDRSLSYKDGLPLVNRRFALEPRLFSRFRWALRSKQILNDAHAKYWDRPYRLSRGDTDMIVFPNHYISQLNALPLSSRRYHSRSMIGHLNGLDAVNATNYHVKIMLSRLTPALPALLVPIRGRIQSTMMKVFPQSTKEWTELEPINKVVQCMSEAVTFVTFGPPMLPTFLQPLLVWLLPYKWRLEKSWKTLEEFVVPEAEYRKQDPENRCNNPDLISWMITDAKNDYERDPVVLTRLIGAVIAGGTYSTSVFIMGVISNLVEHPHYFQEIRDEIREMQEKVRGNWDFAAFNALDKLDSAMKETSRLAPGSLLVYSREVQEDCALSSGLHLHKGQMITTSGYSRAMDPGMFPDPLKFDALRAYDKDLDRHRAQPFRSVNEAEDYRWGAGRWACPGRFVASIVAKTILVKLLDEYEFKFVQGKRPPTHVLHEFVFMSPQSRILMRRREKNSGIVY